VITGIIVCASITAYSAVNAGTAASAAAPAAVNASVNKTGVSAAAFDTMKQNVASAGITFTQSDGNLDIVMDEAKLLAAVPALVKAGAIAKVADSDIKLAPLSIGVYAAGVTFSVTIMSGVYAKDPALDKLHVTFSVMPTDGKEKQLCYSYDYTRSMYDKLDLNTTTTNDFMTKTPGFMFSDWCKSNLDKEDKAISAAQKPAK
jgi:hypothetical protein